MSLFTRLRLLARRHRGMLALCVLAVLALPQALPAARTLLLGEVPPSLQALCSSASGQMGAPGGEAEHAHDCCVCQAGGTAALSAALVWRAPEGRAWLPALWLAGPRHMAAWTPQRSRAPPVLQTT